MQTFQHIIRITGDNPLTDPFHAISCLDHHCHFNSDYTNMETIPIGCRSEIISFKFASFLLSSIQDLSLTEYLTFFLRQDIGQSIEHYTGFSLYPNDLNLTLDTIEDYHYLKSLFSLMSSPLNSLPTIINTLNSSLLIKPSSSVVSNNSLALEQNNFAIKSRFLPE